MTDLADIDNSALTLLQQTFGYDAFRGDQQDIINHLVAGGDALVLMPTGGGKSLCYQIPALLLGRVGIVISPLIALMQDQVMALRQLGVRAAFLNSSLAPQEQREVIAQLESGQLQLLYLAPERALQADTIARLQAAEPSLLAIDEAHCVSNWGHDFRQDYLELATLRAALPGVPAIALTATADARTREDIVTRLQLQGGEEFIASFDRPNLHYSVRPKTEAKSQLKQFLEGHRGSSGIVYCLARKSVEGIADWLQQQGYRALPYHAGLDRRRPRQTPGTFRHRRRRDHGRHHCFRHGHRQTGRTLRGAHGSAQIHGVLLPGNRARRARR